MFKQDRFLSANHVGHDLPINPEIEEHALNAFIIRADITRSFEEYLEIFDAFYSEDIKASSGTGEEPIHGKAKVRSLLLDFLIPLHVMAEIGGLSISLRSTAIPGDIAHETHSSWTLDLVAPSGKTCTLTWRTFRRWSERRVVWEHHYDHQQIGGPLTLDDLSLANMMMSPSW